MGLGWIGFSHNGYSEAVGSEELGFAALEPAVDYAALHHLHHLGIQSEIASS